MKKTVWIMAVIMAVAAVLCCFTACNKPDTSKHKLAIGEKYIEASSLDKESAKQNYYIFFGNNTGKYYFYFSYNYNVKNYCINFVYTIDDEKLYCFYDSIEYFDGNIGEDNESSWYMVADSYNEDVLVISCSDDVVVRAWVLYVNENYAGEIPNYRKG